MRAARLPRPAVRRAVVLAAGLTVAAAAAPHALTAQEPVGPGRTCTLVLEPATDSTRSTAVQVAEGQYVTHVGNGLRWTCGDSRMYADSAVKYDRERRLKAIGSIDYRDSVRTLTADTLTYYEDEDRLVAQGDAVLRRRDRGATLSGPRIEFLRAAAGAARRTVATGRPHLTVRPSPDEGDSAAPVELDADRIVLEGRDEIRSWGDVRIERPDVDARADSAFFFLEEGEGRLFGTPEVDGRDFTLTGRTIRTGFADGELDRVVARDSARAFGEDFELYSDVIRARLARRQVEQLWAYGEGRSVALAPPYRLEADSLAFRFRGGRLDTLRALVGAEAVEVGDSLPADPMRSLPLAVGDRSWLSADTLVMAFAGAAGEAAGDPVTRPVPDSVAAPDSAGAEGAAARTPVGPAAADTVGGAETDGGAVAADGPGATRVQWVHAIGSARAYRVLRPRDDPAASPARHYQRGRSIVVHFEDGEASRVEGEQAIGVHLDPMAGAERPRAPAPAGGAAGASDTAAADTAPEDTAGAAPPAPPDSAAPADTAGAGAVPDTSRAPGDTAGTASESGSHPPAAGRR